MSYAIANVVYGLDASEESQMMNEIVHHYDGDQGKVEDFCEEFCKHLYSGNGPQPRYIGVSLCRMDECNNVPLADLKLTPTEQQVAEFDKLYQSLPEDVRSLLDKRMKPQVWVIWSSS